MSSVSCAILTRRSSAQVVQRPHVVEAIGQLHEDDADVVHHRQQHLAEVLGLALFARLEGDRADLGDALDDVRDLGPEPLGDDLDGGERVLDDVVEQAGGDRDNVELQVGEEVGHLEGMHHVRLPGVPHLPLVLEGREHVGAAQQLEIGIRAVCANLLKQILEANHGARCLSHVCWWTCFIIEHRGRRPRRSARAVA